MYFLIILFLSSQTCVAIEVNVRCTVDSSQTVINCNFIEEGVYKILEIPEGVNKVVFDRLTNSKVELSRQIKFLTISSSAFDNYEPCQHIIAYGDVWVMEEETETLTTCREAQLTNPTSSNPDTTTASSQSQQASKTTNPSDTTTGSRQSKQASKTTNPTDATTASSQSQQVSKTTSNPSLSTDDDLHRFIWIAIIPTLIVIIAFICFIINMIRRWIRRRRLSTESRSEVIFEMSTSKID